MGMHRHLGAWWDDMQQRLEAKGKKVLDGLIHRITHNEWTKEDITKYKTDFKVQPCRKGQICVSLPHLPHGAQPAKGTRRTILPWYIGVAADHETLDIPESGTWSELSAAHQDLVPGPSSSSSLHNLFEAPPYLFLAAVQVTGLGPISDALVGRLWWNNSTVLQDLALLFGSNNNVQNNYIKIWQGEARQIIREKWVQVEYLERVAFQEKSFFYC